MQKLTYRVQFVTPAFLGDANQTGRWRTPPFKALLRQWWRVVYAADHNFAVDVAAMRREEGLLFGNAWLSHREDNREVADYCKSKVRIRLDKWDEGDLTKDKWPKDSFVTHPEVKNREGKLLPGGSALYMGFGPLMYDNQRRTTILKANAAIQAGEAAGLSIAVPAQHAARFQRVLWLMNRYGTLGGRSRNGWGSFILTPADEKSKLDFGTPFIFCRFWRDALGMDWPHAVGQDGKGALIWQTKAFDDWKSLMQDLAIVKIGFRTQFVFLHLGIEPRHWLSYPITTHTIKAWQDARLRLPNSLRFKVRLASDEPKKLVGVIYHMPCLPPPEFKPDRATIAETWQSVHALLDELCKPETERSYASITNSQRRSQLEKHLNKVKLTRIQE